MNSSKYEEFRSLLVAYKATRRFLIYEKSGNFSLQLRVLGRELVSILKAYKNAK